MELCAFGDRPRRTWEDDVVRWIDESATKTTQSDDIRHLRLADPFLGGQFLDEITRDLLTDLSTAKKATGVANSTVNRMMEVVRAILHRANVEWDWIDRTPAIRMLSETKRRIRWLTKEDASKLLLELPDHLEAMTRFALATGLREANVTGLDRMVQKYAHLAPEHLAEYADLTMLCMTYDWPDAEEIDQDPKKRTASSSIS